MELDTLDREIAEWKSGVDRMLHNIVELTDLPVYLALSKAMTSRPVAPEAAEAVAAVAYLLEDAERLGDLVRRAQASRADLPLLRRAQAIDRIGALFSTRSIALPVEEVPIAERGLMSSGVKESSVSPQTIQRRMIEQFDATKSFFAKVERVWAEGRGRVSEARRRARALADEAAVHFAEPPAELAALESAVEALGRQMVTAPTTVIEHPDALLAPHELAVRALIQARLDQQAALREQVEQADARLEVMRGLRAECFQLHGDVSADAGPDESLGALPGTRPLVEQVDALKAALATREWSAIEPGVAEFNRCYRQAIAPLRAISGRLRVLAERRAGVNERWAEVRVRLCEVQAKGVGIDGAIQTFADKIRAMIKTDTPLDRVERGLDLLEGRLEEELAAHGD
jgi:hypothetical protein